MSTPKNTWLKAGLLGRCPRCAEGALFEGFLGISKGCSECGLDYGNVDTGDGPAVFIILIVGFIVVGGALFMELTYQPSYWVQAAVWLPVTLILSLGLLRPFKASLIALAFKHDAAEGRLSDD
jgi:uncharacterized protein (DUF983 family)